MQDILNSKVLEYVNSDIYISESDMIVSDVAKNMIEKKLDSVIVKEGDEFVGIVTNTDILKKVVAAGKDPNTVKLHDIKNYPIIEIHQDSRVSEAIAIMNKHDIRRLLVRGDKRLTGMITRKQIVGNMGKQQVVLPELESPNQIKCPYCESVFEDKDILSKHIDDIHIGKGLLEGNTNQI